MKLNTIVYFFFLLQVLILSCQRGDHVWNEESNRVTIEVRKTLNNYFKDINAEGPLAELKYLDSSAMFSWHPPGFNGPMDYNSIKTILIQNAASGTRSVVSWDSLEIFPQSKDKAKYEGKITVHMTSATGQKNTVYLSEEGNLARKKDGWKLLSGKTDHWKKPPHAN